MGFGSRIKKFAKKAEGQTRDQVDRAKDPNRGIWGDNPYSRWAERLTGVSTFKSAVGRHTNGGELDGNIDTQKDPYDAAKTDANKGRPTKAYQDETVHRPEAIAEQKKQEADALFQRRRIAEEARARGQVAVRVRRGMRDAPSTKGGTIATGAGGLGSTGGFGSFAALLGL